MYRSTGPARWLAKGISASREFMLRRFASRSRSATTQWLLELLGVPDIDARAVIKELRTLARHWCEGCKLRNCWFEPIFHKLCTAIARSAS
jgi:hypothetical protein